jgi:hypothetical protein
MSILRLAGTVAAMVALAPLCAAATDQDDALRLASRVAANGISDTVVMLHAAPKDLPASVPLPGATLLGSVARAPLPPGAPPSVDLGRSFALYYDAPNRDAALKAYEDALRAAGWKRVDLGEQFPLTRGGFVSPAILSNFYAWCSPDDSHSSLHIGTPPRDSNALDVRLNVGGPLTNMQCGKGNVDLGNGVSFSFSTMFAKSPLPPFTAQSGIAIQSAGPVGIGSTTTARITSALGIAAVFESFARQLRDAGWTARDGATSAGVRSQTFTKTVDGKAYVAVLTLTLLDQSYYAAIANVVPLQE